MVRHLALVVAVALAGCAGDDEAPQSLPDSGDVETSVPMDSASPDTTTTDTAVDATMADTELPDTADAAADSADGADTTDVADTSDTADTADTADTSDTADTAIDTADTAPVVVCGNGSVESGEACDGTNLKGQTCVTRGYRAGALRCATGCLTLDERGCTNVVINEVDGNPSPDRIELFNTGTTPADISGYTITDNSPTTAGHVYTFAPGTVIAAGGYRVVTESVELTFGLGSADEANFFEPGGTRVDQIAWTSHAAGALARCPNGGTSVVDVATPTFGASNATACP